MEPFDVLGPLPEPQTTTVLEASAGTGKTFALAALVARYVAEGAWNPRIESRSFYKGYLGRVFGPEVAGPLAEAYLLLDRQLGFRKIGNGELFIGYNRFHLYPLAQRSSDPLALAKQRQSRSLFPAG